MRFQTIAAALLLIIATVTQATPDAKSFGALPNIGDAAISPDASQIAMILNVDGAYVVRVMHIDNLDEPIRAIALASGVKPRWIRWVNNDRVFVAMMQYESIRGRSAWSSFIYTLDVNAMEGKFLIRSREIFRQDNADVIDFLDDDPEHVLMAFSDKTQLRDDIQRVNVETGKYRRLERGLDGIQSWYTDQTGVPRVGQGRLDQTGDDFQWRLIIRNSEGDKWLPAEDFPGLEADTKIIGFNRNPNELLIGYRGDKSTMGVFVYDLEKKEIGRSLFHHDDYDVSGLVRNADGDVIGARYIADEPQTELLGAYDTHMERMRQRFPEHIVRFVDQSDDGNRLLFRASNSSDPGSLLLSDRVSNKIISVSKIRSKLPAAEMGSVSAVKYTARDGFEIPAYLTLPPSIRSADEMNDMPTIILPHGGPYSRSFLRFDYLAQFFATRGFAVLQMNFRGSAGYGEEFEGAGRSNWELMQEDVEDATRWALEKGIADPERTCIAGWSYGGYAALMGSITNPELYACAISIAGITDIQDLVYDLRRYRFGRTRANKFISSGFEDKQAMKDNSPVRRADELTVPLFLAHADEDLNVDFDHFLRMRKALSKNKARVVYLEVEHDDHFFSVQENRESLFIGMDEFLMSTIGRSEFAN